ncbi:MAG: hydrogenase expression/formation protein HypE [Bacteroidota bacterium]
MNKKILLGHGSGGKLTHDLIKNIFIKSFNNDILNVQGDSSVFNIKNVNNIAFTTDSYVVDPIFFPGGDIGKLAVCGTVNDLAVSGAKPLYLSAAFIIEEGFPIDSLETIVESMVCEAKNAGISIVTGDTKVVNKGKCDKIFINTAGIGIIDTNKIHISKGQNIKPGDKIIINGTIGDHGMTIMKAREFESFNIDTKSDCACLNSLIDEVLKISDKVNFMRDATRGGLASVLCEIVENKNYGISIDENNIKITEGVSGMCEILGLDPIYVANEGKVVIIVGKEDADNVLNVMQKHDLGMESSIIGEITEQYPGKCWMNTEIGGKRIIDMLAGEQLPRIC